MEELVLAQGPHASRDKGVCMLEAVAWVAGEPHSDHPACVCPVIAAFGRRWNDTLNDADRTRLLKPLVPLFVGTAGGPALRERRSLAIVDWFVREWLPLWLELTPSLEAGARELRSLSEIRSWPDLDAAQPRIEEVARSSAGAWAAAWAAASAGAWDAACAAAWAAVWDGLAPVVAASQESAVELLKRLCAMKDEVSG